MKETCARSGRSRVLGQSSCTCRFPALGRKHECQPPDLALVCCILLHPKSMIAHPIRALPRAPIALYAIAIGR